MKPSSGTMGNDGAAPTSCSGENGHSLNSQNNCLDRWVHFTPRLSRIIRAGMRLFGESLSREDQNLDFQRKLITVLWGRRNADLILRDWLTQITNQIIRPFGNGNAALHEEIGILTVFAARLAPGEDYQNMILSELAGDGPNVNRLTLSTLHSSKGREFRIVFMFGMDDGRIPRNGVTNDERAEARRLFYVGMTRAKSEIHLLHTAGRASPFVSEIDRHLAEE